MRQEDCLQGRLTRTSAEPSEMLDAASMWQAGQWGSDRSTRILLSRSHLLTTCSSRRGLLVGLFPCVGTELPDRICDPGPGQRATNRGGVDSRQGLHHSTPKNRPLGPPHPGRLPSSGTDLSAPHLSRSRFIGYDTSLMRSAGKAAATPRRTTVRCARHRRTNKGGARWNSTQPSRSSLEPGAA